MALGPVFGTLFSAGVLHGVSRSVWWSSSSGAQVRIVIHSVNHPLLPRLVARDLRRRLRVMPAVVVAGARQAGKSTLAQDVAPRARRYHSLDDLDVLDLARRDPDALLGGGEPVTLDEVQRAPDLLHAVKREIDRSRRPGRFLLTGRGFRSAGRGADSWPTAVVRWDRARP